MKKVITYNNYTYYIGNDNGNLFYNIVPDSQPIPNGGYSKEWILKVKNLPDLFDITKDEIKRLKQAKKELLTDRNATPSSQTKNSNLFLSIATKYNANLQLLHDSIKF